MIQTISNFQWCNFVITYLQTCETGPWLLNRIEIGLYVTLNTKLVHFFQFGAWNIGAQWERSGPKIWWVGVEGWADVPERCVGVKKNWLEREHEVTERGAGVTEIGLSDEWKFCRSRSAHMLCSRRAFYGICNMLIESHCYVSSSCATAFNFSFLFMAALCNRAGHIHFHPVVS